MAQGVANTGKMTLAGRLLTPDGVMESGIVEVADGTIQAVRERAGYSGAIDVDAGDALIAPGFIDIHIHGAVGTSFMGAPEKMDGILRHHFRNGTTSLLATTSTGSGEKISAALVAVADKMREQAEQLERLRRESPVIQAASGGDGGSVEAGSGLANAALGSNLLGAHVEGPYLNLKQAGAQNPEWLRHPDLDEYKGWEKLAPIKMITIAPELPGAEAVIRYIRSQGRTLISAGHTDAVYEEMLRGIEWGVTHCTHFGNGMRGLHHREPGVFGSGLLRDELTVELICDGIHVHPQVLELVYRVKGAASVALITDAVAYCGLPDGVYRGDTSKREVIVENGSVRLKESGGLSGSSLTMNRGAKRMADLGASLSDVWQMASATPARLLGLADRKGALRAGMDADLIVLDRDFAVLAAMVGGVATRWGV
jgi:N-acetylglucosamine-6-phosphate deacetylase